MPIKSIDDTIYGGLFGNATRSVGLAFNLSKLGYQVYLEVEEGFQVRGKFDIPLDLSFIKVCERSKYLQMSNVCLISCTSIESISQLFDRDPYLSHPCKVIASCFDNGQRVDLNRLQIAVRSITFNNSKQKNIWDERGSLIPSVEIAYGVNESTLVDEAIVETKPSAIWIGGIRRIDMLQRIVRFASVNSDCKVTVIARSIFDASIPDGERGSRDNPYADFVNRDKLEHFHDIVFELCGIETPNNIEFLGPMEGENHRILGEHTIGLDFSRFPAQTHDNTKIMDYLRSGLSVICDRGTPSFRFVEETGHGVVVSPEFDDDEIREAYKRCMEMAGLARRKRVATYMLENYGWPCVAQKFSDIVNDAYGSNGPSKCRLWIYRFHQMAKRQFKFLVRS